MLVFHLLENSSDNKIYTKTVDLVEKNDVFKWKGHQRLQVKDAHQFESAGYQAHCIIQVVPPAAVTSVALENRWGLAGIGSSHGFTLFDFRYDANFQLKLNNRAQIIAGASRRTIAVAHFLLWELVR